MDKAEIKIWGRKYQLDVVYDCFDDEEVLDSQESALEAFLDNAVIDDDSLDAVKRYCEFVSNKSVLADDIDDVFVYVAPDALFVLREPADEVAILCEFEFDIEHGMAIVFKDGKLDRIDSQHGVL